MYSRNNFNFSSHDSYIFFSQRDGDHSSLTFLIVIASLAIPVLLNGGNKGKHAIKLIGGISKNRFITKIPNGASRAGHRDQAFLRLLRNLTNAEKRLYALGKPGYKRDI